MGVITLLYQAFTVRCQRRSDGFTLWLENGQLQSSRSLPSDPDWQMLVELCGEIYQAQGHAGAHRWIEMLPEPYQSEMWAQLEKLDAAEYMQKQGDNNEEWV
jgi:hypothetical protein